MTRVQAIAHAGTHFDDGGFLATLTRRVAFRSESQGEIGRASCRERVYSSV